MVKAPHKKASSIAALAAALLLGSTIPAFADVADDGQWYIDLYDIPDYHAQGIDGSGVQIAVIDGFINPDAPPLAGANVTIHEGSFCLDETGNSQGSVISDAYPAALHGTNVTAMIAGTGEGPNGTRGIQGIAPGADVHFYGIGNGVEHHYECYGYAFASDEPGEVNASPWLRKAADAAMEQAISQAIDDGADIISLSVTFAVSEFGEQSLARALNEGVIVVSALPNADSNPSDYQGYRGYNGVIDVMSVAQDGYTQLRWPAQYGSRQEALEDPNAVWTGENETDVAAPGIHVLTIHGDDWSQQELGTGTSYATPITAGSLALAMQANAEATSNQILQLLIHNTGADSPHEPVYDPTGRTGYGYLDPISLLADDASQYDDINPFIDTSIQDDDLFGPSVAEIEASAVPATTATATPEDTDEATAAPASGSSSTPTAIWFIAAAVIVLIGVIISTIVIARSRRNS